MYDYFGLGSRMPEEDADFSHWVEGATPEQLDIFCAICSLMSAVPREPLFAFLRRRFQNVFSLTNYPKSWEYSVFLDRLLDLAESGILTACRRYKTINFSPSAAVSSWLVDFDEFCEIEVLEVWVGNWPYAYGHIHYCKFGGHGNRIAKYGGVMPNFATRRRLRRFVCTF